MYFNIEWMGMNVLSCTESLLNLQSEKQNMINTEDINTLIKMLMLSK